MLNFENLNSGDLSKIIKEKKHTVICVDQSTANNVDIPINQVNQYSMPLLPEEEYKQLISASILLDSDDKTSLWRTFILLAYNEGATITFTNKNQIDCWVEIKY